MKYSLIIPALILITLTGYAAAYQSPWKSSHYLYSGSNPALNIGEPVKLLRRNGLLYLCGKEGIILFSLKNKKWETVTAKHFSLSDAALGKKYLALTGSKGIVLLDAANGKTVRTSSKLPVNSTYRRYTALNALPDGGFIVFMIDSLYHYNPENDTLSTLKTGLKNAATSFAELNGKIYILNSGNLFCYDGKEVSEYKKDGQKIRSSGNAKNIFTLPGARWLCISSTAGGVYLLDPGAGKSIDYTGRKNPVDMELAWWGCALDKNANILYVPGWNNIAAIANADTPQNWRIVDRPGPCDDIPLYTHKCVYPQGKKSVVYLPESGQLLFAGSCGITVLSKDSGSYGLPENENFSKFTVDNSTLPGKGNFYDWLRKTKFFAIYATSAVRISAEDMENYRKLGANSLIFNIFNIEHGQFYPPHDVRDELSRIAEMCGKNDIKLFAHLTPYNISINNSGQLKPYVYRTFICSSGKPGAKLRNTRKDKYPRNDFPCYLDREYSQRAGIAHQLKELAELSLKIKLQGVCLELGDGFNGTNIKVRRDPCFCDSCWQGFLKESLPANKADLKLPPAQRYRHLLKLKKWDEYLSCQRRKLADIAKKALLEARKINPELLIILMLPETTQLYPDCWFYNAFIEGMSSPDKPVLVASEQTYGSPYMPLLVNEPEEQWRKQGLPVIMISGISYFWMSPQLFVKRSENYLRHSAGIYIYQGNNFSGKHLNSNVFKPLNKSVKSTYTLADYLKPKNL
jgi:hypothetical protein